MKTDVGRFYYRSNKGTDFMSYQQTKEAFLRYEERRNKLSLLYIEILSNLTIGQEIIRVSNLKIEKHKGRYLHYSPLRFETALIGSLLPELYSIVYSDGEMIGSLFRLKLQMSTLNSTLSIPSIWEWRSYFSSLDFSCFVSCSNYNSVIPLSCGWGESCRPQDPRIF